jgi:hypothetical protein
MGSDVNGRVSKSRVHSEFAKWVCQALYFLIKFLELLQDKSLFYGGHNTEVSVFVEVNTRAAVYFYLAEI